MEKGIESTKIYNIKSEIQALREEIRNTENHEELYVFRLENYCNDLRNGIIDDNLNLPSIHSFVFYFSKLKEIGNLEYILNLLHECWILAHPSQMLEPTYKDDLNENLEKIFYNSTSESSGGYNIHSEELNPPVNNTLVSVYSNHIINNNKKLYFYCNYIEELYKAIKSVCDKLEFSINECFIPKYSLHVKLSREQLLMLFEKLASKGYMKDDEETRYSFLALFENTLHTTSRKIVWLDSNKKNKEPSIASLYAMFSAIEVDMNIRNKNIICKFFNDANNNPISPESLKPRNDSKNLQNIKNIVADILNSNI